MHTTLEQQIDRFHTPGVIDLHFDLPLDLYDRRTQNGLLRNEFVPELRAGGMSLVGAAIFVEDKDLPEMGLRVALDQVARLYDEVALAADDAMICRSYADIETARAAGKIGVLITMEGVEPLGTDLHLLRAFYELGVRSVGLTHARRNAAGDGGLFAPSGSHLRAVGARGGVVGINAVLLSAQKARATLDHYVDHVAYVADLAGIDAVGIGFDFIEFLFRHWTPEQQAAISANMIEAHHVPGLTNHSHARNLTRQLIARGFRDDEIEKILYGNWLRVLKHVMA